VFIVWDVLHLDGRATRVLPLDERQALLGQLLPARGRGWQVAEPADAPLHDVLAVVAAHQLEGVIAKRLDSRWQPARRTHHWRKHKLRRRYELEVAA
jgi:bifunctional non-homologous end joining protein LigD